MRCIGLRDGGPARINCRLVLCLFRIPSSLRTHRTPAVAYGALVHRPTQRSQKGSARSLHRRPDVVPVVCRHWHSPPPLTLAPPTYVQPPASALLLAPALLSFRLRAGRGR